MDGNVNGIHAALIISDHLDQPLEQMARKKKKDWLETTEPKIILMRAFKLNYF